MRRSTGLRRWLAAIAFPSLVGFLPIVQAQPIAIAAQPPRSFGYSIGDRVERLVEIDLGTPWSLAQESVPTPGRQNAWFDLAEASVLTAPSPTGRHVTLRLVYQLLNSPTQPTVLLLPRVGLRFEGGPAPVERDVAPVEIFAAPLIPAAASGSTLDAPRADRKPEPIPVDAVRDRMTVYAFGAAALLLAMLVARQIALRRHAGPFVRACRELRRLAHAAAQPDPSAAMRIVHRALDETAGHTVFLDNVETLFATPHRAPLRDRTRAFLGRSRQQFFAGTGDPLSLNELREFARAWRALEAGHR
jgi:mxaA protein